MYCPVAPSSIYPGCPVMSAVMARLPGSYRRVLERLVATLNSRPVPWAVTGSTSFVLQNVPLTPNDIDVQTSEAGAYEIEDAFADAMIVPVSFSEAGSIRSHFGVLELEGVRVEVMGALQKRLDDGTWEAPIDITDHRGFVDVGGVRIPVLSLAYEAEAYERLGRAARAELLREHADP